MSLQVEKMEKNMAKLTIEVSAEEFEKALEGLNDYLPKLASYKGQLSDEAKLKEYLLLSDELETKLEELSCGKFKRL